MSYGSMQVRDIGGRVRRRVSNGWYAIGLALLTAVAAILRIGMNMRPGFDVDETLYASIAGNLADHGHLAARDEYIAPATTYTSHPPFLFLVEAFWFKLVGPSVVYARLLMALAGVATVLVVGLVMLGWSRSRAASLTAAGFVAVDGWVVFTNRVGWAENLQIPLGLAALWLFWKLVQQRTSRALYVGGFLLGAITIYKFVGVTFLLGGLLYLLIERFTFRQVLRFLVGFATLLGAYAIGMSFWVGKQFWADNYHQFLRATGQVQSRGAVTKGSDIVSGLLANYSIYLVSIGLLAAVGLLLAYRLLLCLLKRSFEPVRRTNSLLFAWTLASYAVFGLGRLTLPHYLILLLIPAICYLVAELGYWLEQNPGSRLRVATAAGLALAVLTGGAVAYTGRILLGDDNAVAQTAAWLADDHNASAGDKVIADEFMGNLIRQPYCKITHAQECEQLGGRPRFIVTYTTRTQKLPVSQALDRLLAIGVPVKKFTGFKETIVIYRLPPA